MPAYVDGTDERIFPSLRSTTVDAYLKAVPFDVHHIEGYNAFCAQIPDLLTHVGPYCISNCEYTGIALTNIILVTWHLEFVDICYDVEDKRRNGKNGKNGKNSGRTPMDVSNHATPEQRERARKQQLRMNTPQHARNHNETYSAYVGVKIVRCVYATRADLRQKTKDTIIRILNENIDERGSWLCSQFQAGKWPILTQTLLKVEECSGCHCIQEKGGVQFSSTHTHRISIPRLVGSHGCVMSPERRRNYSMQDYCDIDEDPYDIGGVFIIRGKEKTFLQQELHALNRVVVRRIRKDGKFDTSGEHVLATMYVHDRKMKPLSTSVCTVLTCDLKKQPLRGKTHTGKRRKGSRKTAKQKRQYQQQRQRQRQRQKQRQRKQEQQQKQQEKEQKQQKQQSVWDRVLFNFFEMDNTTQNKKCVYFSANWLTADIPLPIICFALGIVSHREIFSVMGANIAELRENGEFQALVRGSLEEATRECEGENAACRMDNASLEDTAKWLIVNCSKLPRTNYNYVSRESASQIFEERIVTTKLLSHVPVNVDARVPRDRYLGKVMTLHDMCARAMLTKCLHVQTDDIDSLENKRVCGLDTYLSHSFLLGMQQASSQMVSMVRKRFNECGWNITSRALFKYPASGWNFDVTTNKIVQMLAQGCVKMNWGRQVGLTATTNRDSRFQTLSQVRCILKASGRKNVPMKMRAPHTTHWGMRCTAETPDGAACGLNLKMAQTTYITKKLCDADMRTLRIFLNHVTWQESARVAHRCLYSYEEMFFVDGAASDISAASKCSVRVVLDGECIGGCSRPFRFCDEINRFRQKYIRFFSVSCNYNVHLRTLAIFVNAGRTMRPMFNVCADPDREGVLMIPLRENVASLLEGGTTRDRSLITWEKLYTDGTVCMVDTAAQNNAMVATYPRELHAPAAERAQFNMCEIDNNVILGVMATLIPFIAFNQSPRLTYESGMMKQAMAVPLFNSARTIGHKYEYKLYYPQKPLAMTKAWGTTHAAEAPNGQLCLVAVMIYGGFNQEDAFLLNQNSIDRGLFRALLSTSYVQTDEIGNLSTGLGETRIQNPVTMLFDRGIRCEGLPVEDDTVMNVIRNADDDGLPCVGDVIQKNDVIIYTTKKINDMNADVPSVAPPVWAYRPVYYRGNELMRVSSVQIHQIGDGRKHVTVKLAYVEKPTIGNKITLIPGQKGVCGMIYRAEDMPFTRNGEIPDIIMNPHAFPSRMTIGTLLEMLAGKTGARLGMAYNATAWREGKEPIQEYISRHAHKAGIHRFGCVEMYNGFTGQRFPGGTFMGLAYVRALPHIVSRKIHSRARGPKSHLTRQPVKGRTRDGGLRLGEMERDCLITYGVSGVLQERLMISSDLFSMHVCDRCGVPSVYQFKRKMRESCKMCGCLRTTRIELPYAMKHLSQELMSMNIVPRFIMDPDPQLQPQPQLDVDWTQND